MNLMKTMKNSLISHSHSLLLLFSHELDENIEKFPPIPIPLPPSFSHSHGSYLSNVSPPLLLSLLPTTNPNPKNATSPTLKPSTPQLHHQPQTTLHLSNSQPPLQPGFNRIHSTPPRPVPGKLQTILSHQIFLQPIQFHESLLLSLILFFTKFNSPKKILILFSFVPRITSRKPFQKALNMALDLFVDAGRFNLVNVLFRYCRDNLKMNSNICVYNIPIKCCCHAGRVDEGFKLLELMSLRPNLITYSTWMGGLCKEVRMKDAFKVFEEMMDRVG